MDFSPSFQLRLVALLYLDKVFYLSTKKYIKMEFLNSIFLQYLVTFLDGYFSVYKTLPTRAVVEQELHTTQELIILPEEQPLVVEFLSILSKGVLEDANYIRDYFFKFIRSRTISNILQDNADIAIKEGEFDSLSFKLREASRQLDLDRTLEVKQTFSLRNLKEIYESQGGIKTGINLIDNVAGGLMPKELCLFLADTNVGKSLMLTHIGGAAVRDYRRVLHVTLEMSHARTLVRYLANLAEPEDRMTYHNIYNFVPEEEVFQFVEKLRDKYEGYLTIYEFPTGKCSIEDLYKLLEHHTEIELLIIDYLELITPPKRRNEIRHETTDITIALRALAAERGIHVCTATQANRLSHNKRFVRNDLVSEDYNKVRIPDIGIGMGQNKTDAANKEVVLFLARSRNSEKLFAERYFIDFQSMRFKFLRQEELPQQ